MAQGGVTVTGLKELKAAVEMLDVTVTEALKDVARQTAERIAVNAASILRSKTHGTGATADSIRVLDQSDQKRFVVDVPGAPLPTIALHQMKRSGRIHTQAVTQNNLPRWLEYGTRHMAARPFLRPAGDAESDRYIRNMTAAVERTMKKVLG